VYGIIKTYDDKPHERAAIAASTEKAAFNNWMKRHGAARSTILLHMEQRIKAEHSVVEDAKRLWEKLASAYMLKLKHNFFQIREDLWSIKLLDYRDVDNYTSRIDGKVKDYNLSAGPTTPLTTDTDAADPDSAKTIAKMSEQEHICYLLCGMPRKNEWKVFLVLMMDKNATMPATLDEIVTKLIEKNTAITRENWLAPEAVLFTIMDSKSGKASKGGRSPKRDKRDDNRDNKDKRKEKDFRKCFHCQLRGHTTENCLGKQRGDPPKSADTTATASSAASAMSTLTTSIENYWMVAS
jgi:hypothetical protein